MLASILSLVVLSLASAEAPSADDAPAVLAYFQWMTKSQSIGSCKSLFPERAAEFDRAFESWSRENRELIAHGGDVLRAAAEAGGHAAASSKAGEGESEMRELLRAMPAEERLKYCRDYY